MSVENDMALFLNLIRVRKSGIIWVGDQHTRKNKVHEKENYLKSARDHQISPQIKKQSVVNK
jgi:hypothetical protein